MPLIRDMLGVLERDTACAGCRFVEPPPATEDWNFDGFTTKTVVGMCKPGHFFSLSQPLFKGAQLQPLAWMPFEVMAF